MTDSLLSNRFAHRFEPPAVLKAVNDRGALGPLDGRVFKLGPEWNPKAPEGDEPADSDVRIGNTLRGVAGLDIPGTRSSLGK